MLWAIYQRAQSAFKALNNRSVNRELFARYQVTFLMFLGGIGGVVIMFVGLIASIRVQSIHQAIMNRSLGKRGRPCTDMSPH
jgi:hypothetical protein